MFSVFIPACSLQSQFSPSITWVPGSSSAHQAWQQCPHQLSQAIMLSDAHQRRLATKNDLRFYFLVTAEPSTHRHRLARAIASWMVRTERMPVWTLCNAPLTREARAEQGWRVARATQQALVARQTNKQADRREGQAVRAPATNPKGLSAACGTPGWEGRADERPRN